MLPLAQNRPDLNAPTFRPSGPASSPPFGHRLRLGRYGPLEGEEIFVIVEETPRLLPNEADAMRAMQERLIYPPLARFRRVEGRVIVEFVVEKDADISRVRVVRGIGSGCDQEAARLIRGLRFRSGRQRGKAVNVQMTLPVTFSLD